MQKQEPPLASKSREALRWHSPEDLQRQTLLQRLVLMYPQTALENEPERAQLWVQLLALQRTRLLLQVKAKDHPA